MSNSLGVVLIGAGYWGVNYIRSISMLPGVRLVGICDASTERLRMMGERFPEVPVCTTVDELLQGNDFEAAIICSSPGSHYPIASQLIAAKKHVLIEKPMTTSAETSVRLVEQARAAGVILMVGHIFLHNAGVKRVKAEITAGTAGGIHYLYARRTNLGPVRRDVNVFWDLAAHDIAIFNYWLGSRPVWVSAVGQNFLRDRWYDVGFAVLGYPNDVVGNIHVSWADPSKVREVVLVGSEARIVFNDISAQEKVTIYKKGIAAASIQDLDYLGAQFSLRDGDIFIPAISAGEPLKEQILHFLACIRDNTHPVTDGENGLEVVRILEAIDQSAGQHGHPVEVQY